MKYISLLLVFFCSFSIAKISAQEEEFGMASYYSDTFQGRNTAYGDTYDKNEMTCAHKRYPYGTRLRVTRLDNNQSVVVKVIDKGPFIKGRIVDLSYRAAERLGIIDMGDVKVKVEKISATKSAPVVEAPPVIEETITEVEVPKVEDIAEEAEKATPAPAEIEKPIVENKPEEPKIEPAPKEIEREVAEPKVTTPEVVAVQDRGELVGDDYTPYGLYKFALERPKQEGYGVQVASLSNFDNVLKKVASLQAKWFTNILVSMEADAGGKNQYKVILGPFSTQKDAQYYQRSLKTRYDISGFVLNLGGLKY